LISRQCPKLIANSVEYFSGFLVVSIVTYRRVAAFAEQAYLSNISNAPIGNDLLVRPGWQSQHSILTWLSHAANAAL